MSLSNLIIPNKNHIYADELTTNNINVGDKLYIDTIQSATSNLVTIDSNVLINGDITADNIIISFSNLIPSANNIYDIGSSSFKWKDMYLGGNAYIPIITTSAGDISITPASGNINLGGNLSKTSALTLTTSAGDISLTPASGLINLGGNLSKSSALSVITSAGDISLTPSSGILNVNANITKASPLTIGTSSGALILSPATTITCSTLMASQAVVTDVSKNLTSLAYTSTNTNNAIVQRNSSGNIFASGINFGATTFANYQEFTFTPVLKFNGNTTGITYAFTPRGTETRIGRMVYVTIYIALSNKGSATGPATIDGWNTVSNATNAGWANICSPGNITLSANYYNISLNTIQGTASVGIYQNGTGNVNAQLQDTAFANNSSIQANFWYNI